MGTGRATDRRRPRLSRVQLRSILIETGRPILRQEAMGTGAETLTFKRVFARVERERGLRLTNASIIKRVWDSQADFQTDVFVAIAGNEGVTELDHTLDPVLPLLAASDLSTPAARWATMTEVCRAAGASTMVTLAEAPQLAFVDRALDRVGGRYPSRTPPARR